MSLCSSARGGCVVSHPTAWLRCCPELCTIHLASLIAFLVPSLSHRPISCHTQDRGQWTSRSRFEVLTPSVLVVNIAAEIAAARPDVRGPGTFRAALIDELYNLTVEEVKKRANVEIVA